MIFTLFCRDVALQRLKLGCITLQRLKFGWIAMQRLKLGWITSQRLKFLETLHCNVSTLIP